MWIDDDPKENRLPWIDYKSLAKLIIFCLQIAQPLSNPIKPFFTYHSIFEWSNIQFRFQRSKSIWYCPRMFDISLEFFGLEFERDQNLLSALIMLRHFFLLAFRVHLRFQIVSLNMLIACLSMPVHTELRWELMFIFLKSSIIKAEKIPFAKYWIDVQMEDSGLDVILDK